MKNNYIKLAQNLRKNLTPAERKLWHILRKQQLGGFRFRRQVPFKNFILDFVCLDARIVVEVDGGQHNENAIKNYDQQRTELLNSYEYKVLRFWNNQVLNEIENVAEEILKNCLCSFPRRGKARMGE